MSVFANTKNALRALKLKTDQGAELIETMIRVTRQKLESERGTDLQGTSASVPA